MLLTARLFTMGNNMSSVSVHEQPNAVSGLRSKTGAENPGNGSLSIPDPWGPARKLAQPSNAFQG